jgi:hydrogenase maturation factor HypE
MYSIFTTNDDVILDVGGDDAGATVLGRFAEKIIEKGYEMMYVANMYRPMISDPKDAVSVLRDIEYVCGLKATAAVNNSHLKDMTTVSTIVDSLSYAKAVAKYANIPLLFTAAPRRLINELPENESFYPVEVYVRTAWEKEE